MTVPFDETEHSRELAEAGLDDLSGVDVERTRHMLSRGGLREEESAETIIVMRRRTVDETTTGLVRIYRNLPLTRRHDATHARLQVSVSRKMFTEPGDAIRYRGTAATQRHA